MLFLGFVGDQKCIKVIEKSNNEQIYLSLLGHSYFIMETFY